MPMHALVVSLHIAAHAAAPMQSVATVTAVAGRGLEGDRYCEQTGTYSNLPGTGRDVTLIESEAIAALAREYDIQLPPGLARRNIVTRGIALNHLVGKTFIYRRRGSARHAPVRALLAYGKTRRQGRRAWFDSSRRAARGNRQRRRDPGRRAHFSIRGNRLIGAAG